VKGSKKLPYNLKIALLLVSLSSSRGKLPKKEIVGKIEIGDQFKPTALCFVFLSMPPLKKNGWMKRSLLLWER